MMLKREREEENVKRIREHRLRIKGIKSIASKELKNIDHKRFVLSMKGTTNELSNYGNSPSLISMKKLSSNF